MTAFSISAAAHATFLFALLGLRDAVRPSRAASFTIAYIGGGGFRRDHDENRENGKEPAAHASNLAPAVIWQPMRNPPKVDRGQRPIVIQTAPPRRRLAAPEAIRFKPNVPEALPGPVARPGGGSSAIGEALTARTGLGNGRTGVGAGEVGLGTGEGDGASRVRYGENPPPRYPAEARLRNQEGTVLLRVAVAADGSVERVELERSSGFELLDSSAIDTVRYRWRFVPAEREGVRVPSSVLVPIRFNLAQARSSD